MAWFGPKGVATIAFGVLILSRRIDAGTRIFNIAALAVFASILLHGISDTPGIRWIARRSTPDADASEALVDAEAADRRAIS
jgi:NhaP-type Na+/H+ or K+/H+ antiporter